MMKNNVKQPNHRTSSSGKQHQNGSGSQSRGLPTTERLASDSSTRVKNASNCLYCHRKRKGQSFIKETHNLLFDKHFEKFNFYFAKPVNEIIANVHTSAVILFKDYLYYDDDTEFLKRMYNRNETSPRIQAMADFYASSYKPTFANTCILDAAGIMNKRYQKIDKMWAAKHGDEFQDRPPLTRRDRHSYTYDSDEEDSTPKPAPGKKGNGAGKNAEAEPEVFNRFLPSNFKEDSEGNPQSIMRVSFESDPYDIYNPEYSMESNMPQPAAKPVKQSVETIQEVLLAPAQLQATLPNGPPAAKVNNLVSKQETKGIVAKEQPNFVKKSVATALTAGQPSRGSVHDENPIGLDPNLSPLPHSGFSQKMETPEIVEFDEILRDNRAKPGGKPPVAQVPHNKARPTQPHEKNLFEKPYNWVDANLEDNDLYEDQVGRHHEYNPHSQEMPIRSYSGHDLQGAISVPPSKTLEDEFLISGNNRNGDVGIKITRNEVPAKHRMVGSAATTAEASKSMKRNSSNKIAEQKQGPNAYQEVASTNRGSYLMQKAGKVSHSSNEQELRSTGMIKAPSTDMFHGDKDVTPNMLMVNEIIKKYPLPGSSSQHGSIGAGDDIYTYGMKTLGSPAGHQWAPEVQPKTSMNVLNKIELGLKQKSLKPNGLSSPTGYAPSGAQTSRASNGGGLGQGGAKLIGAASKKNLQQETSGANAISRKVKGTYFRSDATVAQSRTQHQFVAVGVEGHSINHSMKSHNDWQTAAAMTSSLDGKTFGTYKDVIGSGSKQSQGSKSRLGDMEYIATKSSRENSQQKPKPSLIAKNTGKASGGRNVNVPKLHLGQESSNQRGSVMGSGFDHNPGGETSYGFWTSRSNRPTDENTSRPLSRNHEQPQLHYKRKPLKGEPSRATIAAQQQAQHTMQDLRAKRMMAGHASQASLKTTKPTKPSDFIRRSIEEESLIRNMSNFGNKTTTAASHLHRLKANSPTREVDTLFSLSHNMHSPPTATSNLIAKAIKRTQGAGIVQQPKGGYLQGLSKGEAVLHTTRR